MRRFNFEDVIMYSMGTILVLILLAVLIGIVMLAFDDKECAVYSEPKTRHGFVMAGKVAVPTTYTSRDCLVWKEK